MEFSEYYKNEEVVGSYETRRSKGLKSHAVRALDRHATSLLLKNTGERILEAGIGTGFITPILLKHGSVEGFDISEEMINKAKEKFPKMRVRKDDILNLKLKEKYDTIVSIRVISHFAPEEAKTALKNLKKITEKNGHIIFNLENPSLIRRFLRKLTSWGSTYTYQYPKSTIKKITDDSKLKIKKVVYIDHMFLLPIHLLNKLSFNSLNDSIIKIEKKLTDIKFMSNNIFLKCQTQ